MNAVQHQSYVFRGVMYVHFRFSVGLLDYNTNLMVTSCLLRLKVEPPQVQNTLSMK